MINRPAYARYLRRRVKTGEVVPAVVTWHFAMWKESLAVTHGVKLIWRRAAPLILASKSEGRRLALAQTGAPFEILPADIDERAIAAKLPDPRADNVAAALAAAKARAVSARAPCRLVIGADQVASCDGRLFGKPPTMAAAAEQLSFLSGRRHRLHSAVALARDETILFQTVVHADLTMRVLSARFIDTYLAQVGIAATASAGAYQIEGLGAHLFSEILGDHWTILGLPLLPLLAALREEGVLLS